MKQNIENIDLTVSNISNFSLNTNFSCYKQKKIVIDYYYYYYSYLIILLICKFKFVVWLLVNNAIQQIEKLIKERSNFLKVVLLLIESIDHNNNSEKKNNKSKIDSRINFCL